MAARTGADKSSFSLTCNLLCQYLKEKGTLSDLPLGLRRAPEPRAEIDPPPRTMNLLPRIESCSGAGAGEKAKVAAAAAQMTIFYGGRVMVYDNFPADKAKELFDKVGRGSPAAGSSVAPRDAVAPAVAAAAATQPQKPDILPADLPIARRASLNRFLEKRKDRINSRAPYQLHEVAKAEEKMSWLALAPSMPEEAL